MAESKKIDLSMNFDLLPPEMVEKILKLLNWMDICRAQLICRRWNEIIKKGNLVIFGEAGGYIYSLEDVSHTPFGVEDNVYVLDLFVPPFGRPGA